MNIIAAFLVSASTMVGHFFPDVTVNAEAARIPLGIACVPSNTIEEQAQALEPREYFVSETFTESSDLGNLRIFLYASLDFTTYTVFVEPTDPTVNPNGVACAVEINATDSGRDA